MEINFQNYDAYKYKLEQAVSELFISTKESMLTGLGDMDANMLL